MRFLWAVIIQYVSLSGLTEQLIRASNRNLSPRSSYHNYSICCHYLGNISYDFHSGGIFVSKLEALRTVCFFTLSHWHPAVVVRYGQVCYFFYVPQIVVEKRL